MKFVSLIIKHHSSAIKHIESDHYWYEEQFINSRPYDTAFLSATDAYRKRDELLENDRQNIPKCATNVRILKKPVGDAYLSYDLDKFTITYRYEIMLDVYLKEK